MHDPTNWPPSTSLLPLMTSFHVSQFNSDVVRKFRNKSSREFFLKHSPVGARDKATQRFFEELEIPTYFSGCITLTLNRNPKIKKLDYILAVDLS